MTACPAVYDSPSGHVRTCPLALLKVSNVWSGDGPTAMTTSICDKIAGAR